MSIVPQVSTTHQIVSPAIKPVLVSKARHGAAFFDQLLTCMDCGSEFVFSAGEQEFFAEKEYKNAPKHCRACRMKRKNRKFARPTETRTTCAECGQETTVPFKPVHGKPVLCRSCYRSSQVPVHQS